MYFLTMLSACIMHIVVGSPNMCPHCSQENLPIFDPVEMARLNFLQKAKMGEQEREQSTSDDDEINDGGSGRGQVEKTQDSPAQMIKEFNLEKRSCCNLGRLIGQIGYQCKNRRFSRAGRHLKAKLISRTLEEIGISDDLPETQSLYEPLRKCVLKKPHDVDKCCYAKAMGTERQSTTVATQRHSHDYDYSHDSMNSFQSAKHSRDMRDRSRTRMQRTRAFGRHRPRVSLQYDRWKRRYAI